MSPQTHKPMKTKDVTDIFKTLGWSTSRIDRGFSLAHYHLPDRIVQCTYRVMDTLCQVLEVEVQFTTVEFSRVCDHMINGKVFNEKKWLRKKLYGKTLYVIGCYRGTMRFSAPVLQNEHVRMIVDLCIPWAQKQDIAEHLHKHFTLSRDDYFHTMPINYPIAQAAVGNIEKLRSCKAICAAGDTLPEPLDVLDESTFDRAIAIAEKVIATGTAMSANVDLTRKVMSAFKSEDQGLATKDMTKILKAHGCVIEDGTDDKGRKVAYYNMDDRTLKIVYDIKEVLWSHSDGVDLEAKIFFTSPLFSETCAAIRPEDDFFANLSSVGPLDIHFPKIMEQYIQRFVTDSIEWAESQDISYCLRLTSSNSEHLQKLLAIEHLAALAMDNDVEKLISYQSSFAAGDRLGSIDFLTKDHIDRAIDQAKVLAART